MLLIFDEYENSELNFDSYGVYLNNELISTPEMFYMDEGNVILVDKEGNEIEYVGDSPVVVVPDEVVKKAELSQRALEEYLALEWQESKISPSGQGSKYLTDEYYWKNNKGEKVFDRPRKPRSGIDVVNSYVAYHQGCIKGAWCLEAWYKLWFPV